MSAKYSSFSDFAQEVKPFEGEKKKIKEVLDCEILVLDYKVNESKQKQGTQYATIQFKQEESFHVLFTGSSILIEQLEKYKDNLPFYATIKKITKYYTFT